MRERFDFVRLLRRVYLQAMRKGRPHRRFTLPGLLNDAPAHTQ
jgi:hypothetical protein